MTFSSFSVVPGRGEPNDFSLGFSRQCPQSIYEVSLGVWFEQNAPDDHTVNGVCQVRNFTASIYCPLQSLNATVFVIMAVDQPMTESARVISSGERRTLPEMSSLLLNGTSACLPNLLISARKKNQRGTKSDNWKTNPLLEIHASFPSQILPTYPRSC